MKLSHKTNIILFSLLSILTKVVIVSGDDSGSAISERGLLIELEIVTFILFSVILTLNYMNYLRLGNSLISLPFIYILGGISFTIFARLFLILYYLHLYEVPAMVIGIYWHFFIYISDIYFLIAIKKVNDRSKEKELKPLSSIDYVFFASSIIIVGLLYLTPSNLGMSLMQAIMGTVIPEWGLLHFIAFTFTALLTVGLLVVINNTRQTPVGSYLKVISIPFLLFLLVTTLNHFTALITESWGLINVDPVFIERIEQSFWSIGFLILTIGYILLYRVISESSTVTRVNFGSDESENSKVVMKILREHVGSLAVKVSQESMSDSGVKLSDIDEENIDQFAQAVEKNTQELLGHFPSRYLKVSLQRSISSQSN